MNTYAESIRETYDDYDTWEPLLEDTGNEQTNNANAEEYCRRVLAEQARQESLDPDPRIRTRC